MDPPYDYGVDYYGNMEIGITMVNDYWNYLRNYLQR